MKFKGVPSAGFPFDSSHVALSKIETSENNPYIKKKLCDIFVPYWNGIYFIHTEIFASNFAV